jgi:hypothetical protein
VAEHDPLTADQESVGFGRPGEPLRLRDALASFLRRGSPPLLAGALVLVAGLRLGLGGWSWRDGMIVAGLLAAMAPVEWVIHRLLLHAAPLNLFGRPIELLAAREHRAHHESPWDLDGVLLPRYAVPVFALMIAAVMALASLPLGLVIGGDRLAWGCTGWLVALSLVAAYEWCHFLIHTPYRPHTRYFRAVWLGHRLHHFKNEHLWFGVTSVAADRLLRTAPDHRSVPRSETVRRLRAPAEP